MDALEDGVELDQCLMTPLWLKMGNSSPGVTLMPTSPSPLTNLNAKLPLSDIFHAL